jgi:hypothetical protein
MSCGIPDGSEPSLILYLGGSFEEYDSEDNSIINNIVRRPIFSDIELKKPIGVYTSQRFFIGTKDTENFISGSNTYKLKQGQIYFNPTSSVVNSGQGTLDTRSILGGTDDFLCAKGFINVFVQETSIGRIRTIYIYFDKKSC